MRTTTTVTLTAALFGTAMIACGAAPQDSSESTDEAMLCRIGTPCIPPEPPPPRPPPPRPYSCWNPLTSIHVGATCPNTTFAMLAMAKQNDPAFAETIQPYCPSQFATDALGRAQVTLIKSYGCSEPIRWHARSPDPGMSDPTIVRTDTSPACQKSGSYDFAYMHAQLCPYSEALDNYMGMIGRVTSTNKNDACWPADEDPRLSWTACDGMLPAPASGYVWAIVSIDPTCPTTGCMSNSSGGPTGW